MTRPEKEKQTQTTEWRTVYSNKIIVYCRRQRPTIAVLRRTFIIVHIIKPSSIRNISKRSQRTCVCVCVCVCV